MNAIEFNSVSKKFKKGERFDSLRDLIPNLMKTFIKGNAKNGELREKEFWALKDVNFTVKKGEVLGIIGSNGAGKSTILKLLSGILKPTSGEMKINGRLSALIEVGAGFHEDLTGRENIYLNGAIMGMKRKEIDKKYDTIVSFAGLEEFIDTPVKRYSSGMYVRLGFSIAAHMDPEILLIDEVLAVGDFNFQNKCIQKINEIRDSGATIIFISHNLELVRRLCPKSIFLHKGKIASYGESGKAVEQYLKSSAESYANDNNYANKEKSNTIESIVSIEKIVLYDIKGNECNEFKTGDFIKIDIFYNANTKVHKPTFTVGLFSNGQLYADHNSRFEGNDIEYIYGKGKVGLIVKNILLLPAAYEARAHISDVDVITNYDIKSATFFVKENKRCGGQYYQPHLWEHELV